MNFDFFSKILNTPVGITIKDSALNDDGLIRDLKSDEILSFYIKGGSIHLDILLSLKNDKHTFISVLSEIEDHIIDQEVYQ